LKYFIKNAENLTLMPESVKDWGLQEAYTEANQQNWTKRELEDYLRASIKERDEIGRIELAEKKAKLEERLVLVKIMKENSESIDKIIKYTGLTKDILERL
jgi:hypothetical protein